MKDILQLPGAFLQRTQAQFGNSHTQFLGALTVAAPVSIRYNPAKWGEEVPLAPVPWCNNGYYLPERPIFTADPLFHAGAYYVQEASSMFLAQALKTILPPDKDITILDLCAAPGGKSTLINSCISENSWLVANEVIRSRASILEENLSKWGYGNYMVTSSDPKEFGKLNSFFDVIVVDAPCSGEGMFRKDKAAIGEWSEDHVKLCALRQQRIIDDVLPALKPGGFLIYCTCTFAPEENEQNIAHYLEAYSLQSVPIGFNAEWGIEEKRGKAFTYYFYPHKTKGEGFFISCLQKKGEDEEEGRNLRYRERKKTTSLPAKQVEAAAQWMKNGGAFDFIMEKESIYAIGKNFIERYKQLKDTLYITYPGLHIGKFAGDKFIPSHELALSRHIAKHFPSVELPQETALAYLKKGDISQAAALENVKDGWALVQFKGQNLGWIKKIGHRVNNYYPKELRILKDF